MYKNNNRHHTENKSKQKLQKFELLTHLGEFLRLSPFLKLLTVYTTFYKKESPMPGD